MSHAYAARRSRHTAVFTAIVGLHFIVYLIIAMGLVPRVPVDVPQPLPITPLPPPVKPQPVVISPSGPVEYRPGDIVVERPVFPIPDIAESTDETVTSSESGIGTSGEAGSAATVDNYVAPRLRTRSGNLAALIDSCYPAASRRLNEEGRVIAKVTIGAQGSALSRSVAESSGFARLDSAALNCVIRKLEFVAGRRDGQAVAAEAMLPIVFRLD
jgi:periplasmic protein TonB